MNIKTFFDPDTSTFSYVVACKQTLRCAVIDPVLNYDGASGRTDTKGCNAIIDYIREQKLKLEWVLETHVHADHLSGAQTIKKALGGKLAIGEHIDTVQKTFGALFNAGESFVVDGSQFDQLFSDGDSFSIGNLHAHVLHTPGHTPACLSYVVEDAVFVGDTLFMPDYGSARCDFPGGDAATLYQSVQKLFALPDATRVFLCHDYLPDGRKEYCHQTTIKAQRENNIHLHQGISQQQFVQKRESRDKTLNMPTLILPSVQVNMRAGKLPDAEDNGTRYLKIPLNKL